MMVPDCLPVRNANMDRIAKGFSDDEIRAIAAWYGAQK